MIQFMTVTKANGDHVGSPIAVRRTGLDVPVLDAPETCGSDEIAAGLSPLCVCPSRPAR